MMNYPRFFIQLYFHSTFDLKAVALPYNPIYIKKIKSIKDYRWKMPTFSRSQPNLFLIDKKFAFAILFVNKMNFKI